MLERSRRVIPILTLACLAVASFALVACGGGGGGSSADAQKVINETFGGSDKNVNSGKLNLALSAKIDATGAQAAQLKDPVTLKLGGPFQQDPKTPDALPKFDFDLTASAAGQSFTAGAISTGSAGYISYQGSDYKVDSKTFSQFKKNFEKQQAKQPGDNPQLSALGVDPKKWITDPKDEGTENVGGAETNHVSAQINIAAFLDDINNLLQSSGKLNLTAQQKQQLPQELPAKVKSQIQDAIKEAKIDVWSGKDDKILRKLQVSFKFTVPDSLKSQASGLNGGDIELTVELAGLNEPQTITAPANAKSLSELQSLLGSSGLGALGGAGAGTGTTTTPPTGSGTNTPPPSSGDTSLGTGNPKNAQKYLDCIQNANGDQAEITKCTKLLSGQ